MPTGELAMCDIDGIPMTARILLVDDEPLVLEGLQAYLKYEGYEVLPAGSGDEALAIAAAQRLDLLVTDLAMPGIDGLAVIRGVQGRFPGLPSVLLTGYAADEAAIAMSSAATGSFSLLRKPVSEAKFLNHIRALLAARTKLELSRRMHG
jgi:CheY-like chemotaxis protein